MIAWPPSRMSTRSMRMTCDPPFRSRRNVSTKIAKVRDNRLAAVAATKTWRSPPCPPPRRPRTAIVAACMQAIWTTIAPSVSFLGAHLKRILKLGRLRLRGLRGAQDEFVIAAIAQNLRRLPSLFARPPLAHAPCRHQHFDFFQILVRQRYYCDVLLPIDFFLFLQEAQRDFQALSNCDHLQLALCNVRLYHANSTRMKTVCATDIAQHVVVKVGLVFLRHCVTAGA
jgi:hypothetical protein